MFLSLQKGYIYKEYNNVLKPIKGRRIVCKTVENDHKNNKNTFSNENLQEWDSNFFTKSLIKKLIFFLFNLIDWVLKCISETYREFIKSEGLFKRQICHNSWKYDKGYSVM